MKRIEVVKNVSTLFSFCFSYPDGSGGNLTTDNSASARVDEDFISKATPDIQSLRTKGMIMAAPEVPIKARKKLVELGKQNGLFCAASFTSGEINETYESGMFAISDLVAINMDEASAISGSSVNNKDDLPVVEEAIRKLRMSNEKIMVSVTGGKKGSWCSNSKELSWFPAVKTTAVSTAGAGDAFFAGILCGIALGLSMKDSQQLATLVAGMSVTSPHTIHDGINRHSLFEFLKKSDLDFSETIFKILEE